LPQIMKWLKQVFAQRFNGKAGRIGHIWGDRYGSEIVEGEPPGEEARSGVRPRYGEEMKTPYFPFLFCRFPRIFPLATAPPPARSLRPAPFPALRGFCKKLALLCVYPGGPRRQLPALGWCYWIALG
jgi:hypothetical protein